MPHVTQVARLRRALVVVLTAALSLVVTGAASAEFPYMNSGPSVAGTPQEGQSLTGRTGLWLYTSGLKCEPGDCTYTYSWQRCNADASGCADVPAATGLTYLLTANDVGRRMRFVEWVFKRDCGEVNRETGQQECRDVQSNAASALTAPVTPRPVTTAQSTAPPTIQGVPMEDEILRATGGTWTGPGNIVKVIFWQRCNGVGEGCATIAGATGPAYRLTSADVGSRFRVVETATNEGGPAQAVSAPTAVVAELRPTAARPTVAATKVSLPHRLILDQAIVRQGGTRVTVRIRVRDDRGFRVSGVLVKAQPTGALTGSGRERLSDRNGYATFVFTSKGSGTAFVYAEARKKGEKPQSGVSTANLFRVRVR